jgi:hypothetical protein
MLKERKAPRFLVTLTTLLFLLFYTREQVQMYSTGLPTAIL